MSALLKKFSNLLCVKSIVTLVLTVVFAYLAVLDRISNQDFLTIFSVVIAFYFGTQMHWYGRAHLQELIAGAWKVRHQD